jgi:carbon storage regulator CsrA
MLVLSRKDGEQLILNIGGETVTVEICKISGNRVKLGVLASPRVDIRRAELIVAERIAQQTIVSELVP